MNVCYFVIFTTLNPKIMIQNSAHYCIYGANGLAAVCVRRNGVDSLYYVHPDRLGSYTHITGSLKQVVRALHFDPWGSSIRNQQ